MIADNCVTANEVHALLESARPHAADSNLEKAAHLASFTADNSLSPGDDPRESTLAAIETLRKGIDGMDTAEGEILLLEAIRSAERWVRFACSEADRTAK
jgi:hypothetical protein